MNEYQRWELMDKEIRERYDRIRQEEEAIERLREMKKLNLATLVVREWGLGESVDEADLLEDLGKIYDCPVDQLREEFIDVAVNRGEIRRYVNLNGPCYELSLRTLRAIDSPEWGR